ncbi:type II secretion system F family protein [Thermogutta sp.]|uniref:type II secretion system F family protein n=1 Tax=Thermogutta sp. TaxID=1962930 RepID=UPI00321FDF55
MLDVLTIIAQSLDFTVLVPYAVFGMCAALAFWMLEIFSGRQPRRVERLQELARTPRKRMTSDELAQRSTSKLTEVLEKATPALAKPLEPKSEVERSRLKQRLAEAGFRGDRAVQIFLGLKFAALLGGFVLGGSVSLGLWGLSKSTTTSAVIIGGLAFYLPDLVVWFIAKKRKEAIFLGLPDALDLLVVCVEAGLGLDQAMRKVTEELASSHPVIAKEFALANLQLQMGRPRAEVLHEMGVRTGVQDMRALAAVIIQAEKFGSSIAQALRAQSESMRTRRRQMAEERAQKTAVKLIFPLVLFIFPGIFVVLVGPAAITMIRELFPMMAGR